MCTLVAYSRVHPTYPLIVAANRDEFEFRPSAPPQVLEPGVLGGLDVQAGGTWLGVATSGFFVGLTNQRTRLAVGTHWRSRGEIVTGCLRAGSCEAATAFLLGLDPSQYRPFNLLFGDARGLSVAYLRPDPVSVTVDSLPPGQHVLTNDVMGSPRFPKAQRPVEMLPASEVATLSWEALLPRMATMLGDHAHPPSDKIPPPEIWAPPHLADNLQALCVHVEPFRTVSATLLGLVPGGVAHYHFADDAPCRTSFADVTALAHTSPLGV